MSDSKSNEGEGSAPGKADPLASFLFLKEQAEKLWHEWSEKHKRANILIVGKTGVGKSTLINAVFRDNLAETGSSRPVTQRIEEITKPGSPISIFDTRGLELKEYTSIKAKLLDFVKTRRGDDWNTYVHLAWVCIAETGARVEDGDVELARELKELGLSVIVVITKTSTFKVNAFEKDVRERFHALADEVVSTRGIVESQYNDGENLIGTRPVRGIDELIGHSYRFIPYSQRQSFANALAIKNKAAVEAKHKEANNVVNVASLAAGAVGATPIPFADAFALIPIQSTMIAKISQVYGMEVGPDIAIPIVSSLVGVTGATFVGRTVVRHYLSFFQGLARLPEERLREPQQPR